jgi:Protein of unknown function (DUF4031)
VAVYVDDMEADFGRMVMCHMVADSTDELLAMADRIGVHRRWIQRPGTKYEHFDICMSKRRAALLNGAIPITRRELGMRLFREGHTRGHIDCPICARAGFLVLKGR